MKSSDVWRIDTRGLLVALLVPAFLAMVIASCAFLYQESSVVRPDALPAPSNVSLETEGVLVGESLGDKRFAVNEQGQLLVTLAIEPFESDRYRYFKFEKESSSLLQWRLGWVGTATEGEIVSMPLEVEREATRLTEHPQWDGVIEQLFLIAALDFGNIARQQARQVRVLDVQLLGELGWWQRSRDAMLDSDAFVGWDMRSINSLRQSALIPWLSLWACVSVAFLWWYLRRSRCAQLTAVAVVVALAWGVADLAWLRQLNLQRIETTDQFDSLPWEQRKFYALDRPLAAFLRPIDQIHSLRRVLVVTDSEFHAKRARYHLLPTPAAWWRNPDVLLRPGARLDTGDAVVVYGDEQRGDVARVMSESGFAIEVIADTELGVIYRVGEKAPK